MKLSQMLKLFFVICFVSGCGRQNVSQVEEMIPCENAFGSDDCNRTDLQRRNRFEFYYKETYLENIGANVSRGKYFDKSVVLNAREKNEKNILAFEFNNPEKFELIVEVPLKYVTYEYQIGDKDVSFQETVIAQLTLGIPQEVDYVEHLPSRFKVTDTREEKVIDLKSLSDKENEFINFHSYPKDHFKSGSKISWTKRETEKKLVLKTILDEMPPEKTHKIRVDVQVKGHGSIRVKPFKIILQQL